MRAPPRSPPAAIVAALLLTVGFVPLGASLAGAAATQQSAPAAADLPSLLPEDPSSSEVHARLSEDQRTVVSAVEELTDAAGEDPVPAAIATAKAATEVQRQRLSATEASPPPIQGFQRPSKALAELAEREGVDLHPAKVERLDHLAEPLPSALADNVAAFLAMDRAAERAYGDADLDRLGKQARTPTALGIEDPPLLPHRAQQPTAAPVDEVDHREPRSPSEALEEADLDLAEVLAARSQLLDAIGDLHAALATADRSEGTLAANGPIDRCPAFALDLAGDDVTYTRDCAFILDVGGDDAFLNNAGGATLSGGECQVLEDPRTLASAALVSLGRGDDTFGDPEDPRSCSVNGGAALGAGFLFDEGGHDRYTAGSVGANGGGRLGGAGFLVDAAGDETYEATSLGVNGGGESAGAGLLIDVAGEDRYASVQDGTNGGGTEAGVGMLVDLDGDDSYRADRRGVTGGGNTAGQGFVLDAKGEDSYDAHFRGANGGARNGGSGALVDLAGDDTYTGAGWSLLLPRVNGAADTASAGLLVDAAGRDRYQDGAVRGLQCTDCTRFFKGGGTPPGFQIDADDRPTERVEDACEGRQPHPGIEIREDHGPTGFTWTNPVTGETELRPGSGVSQGDGSAENPFVIEGWCFVAPFGEDEPASPSAVHLHGTEAHVVIRDVGITGVLMERAADQYGIHLEDTRNVTLAGNEARHLLSGLLLEQSNGTHARGNALGFNGAGIEVQGSTAIRLAANTIENNGAGVFAEGAPGIALVDNEIPNSTLRGASLLDAPDASVDGNVVQKSARDGLFLVDAPGATVAENLVTDHGREGLGLVRADGSLVANNTAARNELGVQVWDSSQVSLTHNVARDNDHGLHFELAAEDHTVRQNNLHGNAVSGLDARSADDPVDARHNWWGCPEGPEDPACDAVLGDVSFDPWQTEPVPDAGAG